jgi:excisionase family DNA binding protein
MTTSAGHDPLLVSIDDAAQLLGVGRTTAYAMLAAGELPRIRIGRCVRIPRSAVDRFIEEHLENPCPPTFGPDLAWLGGVRPRASTTRSTTARRR